MRSIRSKITFMTACSIVITMLAAATIGSFTIRGMGTSSANQSLLLLCEVGQKNLDSYFESVEQSVEMVSSYVESDLVSLDDAALQAHLERVEDIFKRLAYDTHGVLTYYYRIDPAVSTTVKGFWYVYSSRDGFRPHAVTDISRYDVEDTSALVWFTVPKATGKGVWLPPYITENLGARVISYNVPVYLNDTFVGVIGIEIDCKTMAAQVDNITLYENGYAFVNDAEGNIIYHPRVDVFTLTEQNKPKVPSGMLSDDKFIAYTYEGVEKQAVWLPLSNGMRLNVSVPVSEINAGWRRWVLEIVLIFAALLVAFLLLIKRFAKEITQPLLELTSAAEQVNEENFDIKLDYNGDDEVGILTRAFKRMGAHLQAHINALNDLAYADALTAVHNKGAFDSFLADLDAEAEAMAGDITCAICIFDCNNLKEINDRFGHDKGDEYLKASCSIICEVFDHSPVFRIGGDEFAAILRGADFEQREALIARFNDACEATHAEGRALWEWVNVACGMAEYDAQTDDLIEDTVRRADKLMYENKRIMKLHRGDKPDPLFTVA